MELTDKTILIISPERWGVNFLSKHHYARVLAKKNNRVFFLNPPTKNTKGTTLHTTELPNVTAVDHRSVTGLNRLVHVPFLFRFLLRLNVRSLLKHIPQPDVVWSFDPYRFQDLRLFGAGLCIFHPVDLFSTNLDLICARTSDIIFSVAQLILDRYRAINPNAFFINHGVSDVFLKAPRIHETHDRVECGYVGNMLSNFIDHESLMRIVKENPGVEFHLIGPRNTNNLGSASDPGNPIHQLEEFSNVRFHGEMPTQDVASLIQHFDMFLVCYAGEQVPNNHKILEYLSTGKVVVSSRLSTYDQLSEGLFEMVNSNDGLAARFKYAVNHLSSLNTEDLQLKRIAFARENSYEKQVERIEQHLEDLKL